LWEIRDGYSRPDDSKYRNDDREVDWNLRNPFAPQDVPLFAATAGPGAVFEQQIGKPKDVLE